MRTFVRSAVALVALSGFTTLSPWGPTSPDVLASGSSTSVCRASALTISARGIQAAAGNEGFTVIITNHGLVTCTLDGFAALRAHTEKKSPHPILFVHVSRSQIFITAEPRLVKISPSATASFGVSFTDASDQQYGNRPGCLMTSVTVSLPEVASLRVATIAFSRFGDGKTINACFSAFEFGLTPIVKGSIPPYK